MQPDPVIFQQLGISLLLGLLVGLQREHADSHTAGLRTFALITVLGTVSGILGPHFGGWMVMGGLLGVVAIISLGLLRRLRYPEPEPGNTTNVAMLLMYVVGVMLTIDGMMLVGTAVGGGVAILLQFKPELHSVARKLGDEDLRAIMQFVLITCIILPVLPNQEYGPLDVLNPFKTWLMVVLIVGMSLSGYVAYKFLGQNAGILLGGVLGGAISSTATTMSYSRQARSNGDFVRTSAIVIMIASTVVYIRVLIEIAAVAPTFLRVTVIPVLILMLLTFAPAFFVWPRGDRQSTQMPEQQNPTQLKSAIVFAAMYAIVLLGLAAAQEYLGGQGSYVVAGLSGLTDMDAITLSTAELAKTDPEVARNGWRLILVASLANLLFKAGIARVIGGRRLMAQLAFLFAFPLLGGVALLLFW